MKILLFCSKTDSQLRLMRFQGVELVEPESTVGGEEDDANPRTQNTDGIGVNKNDQPDDLRAPDPHAELPASGVDDHNPRNFRRQTQESTLQVVPEIDSSAHGRPSRQRKPLSWYGTWVAG